MATQHQAPPAPATTAPAGYRTGGGQWTGSVGAAHPAAAAAAVVANTYYQRYAAHVASNVNSASAATQQQQQTTTAAAASAAQQTQQQQQQQTQQVQQQQPSPAQQQQQAGYTNSYAGTNSYTNQRVPSATSPSNASSSSGGSQSGGGGNSQSAQAQSVAASSNSAHSNTGGQSQTSMGGASGQQPQGSEQLSKTNLYIRGLNPSTTDKDLVNMCQQFGTIISTKAILDKNTNKCKGYGFVDFESPAAAEGAVRALTAKNIQAQMAKVGIWYHQRRNATVRLHANLPTRPNPNPFVCFGTDTLSQQQEQDPTNLYIANLPPNFKESDLDAMLSKYGQVISTRILRDSSGVSKGVGFARMESKEKCEQIIQMFNAHVLQGCKEPLLVKFADGGNKKRSLYKGGPGGGGGGCGGGGGGPMGGCGDVSGKMWREATDSVAAAVAAYDPTGALAQNGVAAAAAAAAASQHIMGAALPNYRHLQFPSYPSAQWVPQYVMPAAPIQQMDDGYNLSGHIPQYKGDGQTPRAIPLMMPSADAAVQYTNMLPQLTTQMGAMQLGATGSYISPQYYYNPGPILHAMPAGAMDSEHTSNAASPDDPYQAYQPAPPK